MIRFIISLCLLLSIDSLFAQTKPKKAVFIIIDGVPADVTEKLDLPHFKKIASIGGFARVSVGGEKGGYSQSPTASAIGYNSVLTGTWANKHNVWECCSTVGANYNYPTIFRLLKTQSSEKKIGVFSSWTDNRTGLVGDNLPETGNIAVDYKFDGLEHDTVNYPHDDKRDFMHRIDEKVTDEAAQAIRVSAPDLSWVYLEYTDDMGHAHGDSPEFYKAIDYADQQVGRIWDAIEHRQKNFNEDWLIIVTTDHGRDSVTGSGHGGQSARERSGWIVTNARDLNDRFKKQEGSIVDIMPTIARFMGINIPVDIAREADGVPLTGKLSVTDLSTHYKDGKATLRWQAKEKTGNVKIWVATTNNVKTGGKDEYRLIKEVPLASQHAIVDLKKYPSTFYKIIVEGKNNSAGRWIINETK